MKLFIAPTIVSVLALSAILIWGNKTSFFLAVILVILEVTLSFDNAVVNAKVLKDMSPIWQRRFLTWGILVSVVGTRLVLPIFIVSIAAFISPIAITKLALFNPDEYAKLLSGVEGAIKSFGGAFLLMLSLKYFFDTAKEVHWISVIEKRLVKWGHIEAIEIAIALLVIFIISFFSHDSVQTILRSGIVGIVLFTLTEGLTSGLGSGAKNLAKGGLALFLYLNLIDSAFSLDGVIGAFALTTSLSIIAVGLGIGAYFVRTLTVYLVHKKTLNKLKYLEHGAHWAIFGLALSMFASLIVHVPEVIIGTVGLGFIALSYFSSRKALAQ